MDTPKMNNLIYGHPCYICLDPLRNLIEVRLAKTHEIRLLYLIIVHCQSNKPQSSQKFTRAASQCKQFTQLIVNNFSLTHQLQIKTVRSSNLNLGIFFLMVIRQIKLVQTILMPIPVSQVVGATTRKEWHLHEEEGSKLISIINSLDDNNQSSSSNGSSKYTQ